MSEIPCELVIKHEGILGMMAADVSHIRKKVDNGLSNELRTVSSELHSVEKALADFIAATGIKDANQKTALVTQQAKTDSENWFTRILSGSVIKIIGFSVTFIIVNSLVNSGMGLFLKEKYSLEVSGQQKEILRQQANIQSTLNVYHTHQLENGDALYHSGDSTKPAWMLNGKTNAWEKAPTMRTEAGIK